MYPPGDDQPHHAEVGDRIEHKLMPGFAMVIQAAQECETDGSRSEPHRQYMITDPDGNVDWLCAYDVQAVRGVSRGADR